MDNDTISQTTSERTRRSRLLRSLVILLVGSLTAGALFAVWVLLFGRFGELEGKIVGSTLFLGLFSLTGLGAALRVERKRVVWLGWAGIAASAVAYVVSLVTIWASPEGEAFGRLAGSAVLAAVAAAFVSLLLLIRPVRPDVRWALGGTLVLAAVVWGMLQYLMLIAPTEPDERFLRVLGALAILLALGALVSPILNRLSGQRRGADPPVERGHRVAA